MFDYLLEKIKAAPFIDLPFRHIQINDFFDRQHFDAIIASKEVKVAHCKTDAELFAELFNLGYKIIDFPGCVIDKDQYILWHSDKSMKHSLNNTSCEGFGVTLRLMRSSSAIINELMEFLNSNRFKSAIASKFSIDIKDVFYDAGIQKYLDGYEISPHPDVRKKALTYMVNVNPDSNSDRNNHHTHYLSFKKAFKYVQAYWEGNPTKDRCWVPWGWCETKKIQNQNNSIVIFSPGDDTIHGVKATYNHLHYQRTQLYGNLWFNHKPVDGYPAWECFVISQENQNQLRALRKLRLSQSGVIKSLVDSDLIDDPAVIKNRLNRK